MKTSLALLLGLALIAPLYGAEGPTDTDLDLFNRQRAASTPTRAPDVDAKKIINDSNGFLKEREPEMTTEEYALYQKVTTILAGNPQFAITLLEAMLGEKQTPSPAFEFILGNAYYAASRNDKAEAHYRAAVDRYPTFQRAWSNFGVFYYSIGRFTDAATAFARAVSLGDRDPTTFGLLGYSLEKSGNTVAAEMAYMQALGGAPAKADWKEGLLRIYTADRQFGRAESLVRSLIREHPTETRHWVAYANILLSEQKKLKAMAVLECATRAGAVGPDELMLLGDLYAEHHLVPEAAATYRQVLSRQPALGRQRLLRFAQVLIGTGDTKAAAEVLASAEDPAAAPTDRVLLLQTRADLFAAEKKWPEVHGALDALLAIDPLNGRALLSRGAAYVAQDNIDRAGLAFEAAARIPATAYRANLELANIELKNRHYAKGAELLERALAIEKSDAIADLLARVKLLVDKET